MITSVVRAFFHAGSRNAGTPFEIASTPVTAAPPEANAVQDDEERGAHEEPGRRTLPSCTHAVGVGRVLDGQAAGDDLARCPTPSSTTMLTMKK